MADLLEECQEADYQVSRLRSDLCLIAAMAYLRPERGSLQPYAHQKDVNTLAQSQNKFTKDFYVYLAKASSGNLFFSPFSIMTALGMTYEGAKGNTEEEMRSVMHLSQDKESIQNAFQDVITVIKEGSSDYELRTSNMAYVSDQLTLLSEYAKTLSEKYLSTAKTVNFGDSEAVRTEINEAVEKETNSKIKDVMPTGVLDSLTRMVLVNAVYFKGFWNHQFDVKNTRFEDFWISAEEKVKVPMMHITDYFYYANHKKLDSQILAMDYKGLRLSMVFVLPNKRDGLAAVEEKLKNTDLHELHRSLHSLEVKVSLPRFKLEESLELVNHLRGMGMKDLFDTAASDLSGISGNRDLFVSNVFHKAFLEVNEKGAEAAAAIGMDMVVLCYEPPPPEFKVDHPFLFYIRDHQSGLVLFAGRLSKPNASLT